MDQKLTATGLAGLAMALVLVTSVVAPGLAFAATGPSDDGPSGNETDAPTETPTNETDDETDDGNETGPPENETEVPENETGMPAGVEAFTATTPLSGDQTDPSSLAGKLRVESPYSENTTVELLRNSSTNFTLAINVTGGAENVTFYLQETAFAASQNVTNVSATLDGEPLALGRTEASGSPWIGFEVDNFSTRVVTFETDVENGTDDGNETGPPEDPPENETDDGNETGPPGNETGPPGNETGPPGNETGMPAGVEAFTATTPLSGDQTEPSSLAGKLRVESPYRGNTTVELLRNSSTNFTLAINVTGGAENVTFYLQETAFAASQNVTNVSATLDGEPLALGRTEARGSPWIGFEVDEFSTRIVTFETDVEDGTDAPEAAPPPVVGDAAPRDADGDGTYEDVDGDGELTVFDVQAFLDNYRSDAVQNNAAKFDFDGSGGGVDIFDVQALLEDL